MYAGHVACCLLVSHNEYVDRTDRRTVRQMDRRQTVSLSRVYVSVSIRLRMRSEYNIYLLYRAGFELCSDHDMPDSHTGLSLRNYQHVAEKRSQCASEGDECDPQHDSPEVSAVPIAEASFYLLTAK